MVKITFPCSVYCIFTFTGDGNFETFVELAVLNTTITVGVAVRYFIPIKVLTGRRCKVCVELSRR